MTNDAALMSLEFQDFPLSFESFKSTLHDGVPVIYFCQVEVVDCSVTVQGEFWCC
jgi:hypothetical protein